MTPWIAACQASLSITNSCSLLKLMPELVMPSSHLILCRPLLLLPPIPPSISVFSNKSTLCMRWPKYWSFSFSISPSNEHPGLISFRMDWLDLLAVQGTIPWYKFLLIFYSMAFQPEDLCLSLSLFGYVSCFSSLTGNWTWAPCSVLTTGLPGNSQDLCLFKSKIFLTLVGSSSLAPWIPIWLLFDLA